MATLGREEAGHSPSSCVLAAPRSALFWKHEMLANYLDPRAPTPPSPGAGALLTNCLHMAGEGLGLQRPVSEPYGAQGSVTLGRALLHRDGRQTPCFLNYVSLISVHLALGLLLFVFKEKRL